MPLTSVVLGGQGFLGGAVVHELLARGDEVVVLDHCACQERCDGLFGSAAVRSLAVDVLDRDALRKAFLGMDEVYHFAGLLGTSELNDDVHRAIASNITGAVNVFEAAIAADVPAVFYPSKPNVWLNAYTITKFAAEQFAELYRERGARISTLRYFNAYGPRQAIGPVRKIIPTFAMQALRGGPLTVYGDGQQTVDMIYAPDLARITVDVVRSGQQHEVADCGRGVAMSVNAVANAVACHFGSGAAIEHLPMRRGETPGTRLVANIAPLKKLVGRLRFTPWEESLSTTLSWYRSET